MKNKMNAVLRIQKAEELYIIMSKCTKMPFVHCNEDTCDDEIFVFLNEEAGTREVTALAMKDELVDLIAISKARVLGMFSSLFAMGVNSVHIDKGCEEEMQLQLTEIVQRKPVENLVENPSFQLTALYYMQKMRAGKLKANTSEESELREEMMVHFWEGKLILISDPEEEKMVLLNDKEGNYFQPVFTDVYEYQKLCNLNPNRKFKTTVLDAKKAPAATAKDATGIAVNPFSVNLKLEISKKKME